MLKTLMRVLLSACLLFQFGLAQAHDYPSRPVKLLVPFPPGGPTDVLARLVAQKLTDTLGQSFIVENRPGGTGTIASSAVAKAAPDGYTLLVASTSSHISPYLLRNSALDPMKDFTPVASVVDGPIAISVHPSYPGKSVKDLIDLAKANPGKYTYGTNGIGGTYHLEMELFKQQFGINLEQVPYKTSIEAINALVAGEIPLVYAPVGAVMPLVRAGKMRLLVVLDNKRYPDLPNVPAMGEEISGYQRIPTGLNFYGPAGLPPAISRRIHAEVVKALQSPDVPPKLKEFTFFGIGTSPEALAEQQVKDYAIIAKAVKAAGIEAQ